MDRAWVLQSYLGFEKRAEAEPQTPPEVKPQPQPEVKAIPDRLESWAKSNLTFYDSNKDGALDTTEIREGIKRNESKGVYKLDTQYLKMVDNNYGFLSSAVNEKIFDTPKVSMGDIQAYGQWKRSYAADLQTLKGIAPGKYDAVNMLRRNFNVMDENKDQKLSHDELRRFMKRPGLSPEMTRGALALDGAFSEIAESTRMSRRSRKIDNILGYERKIGTMEISQYVVDQLAFNDRRSGNIMGGIGQYTAFKSMAYWGIDTLNMGNNKYNAGHMYTLPKNK